MLELVTERLPERTLREVLGHLGKREAGRGHGQHDEATVRVESDEALGTLFLEGCRHAGLLRHGGMVLGGWDRTP